MRILFFILSIFIFMPAMANEVPQIQINAQGSVKVKPDMASFNLSIGIVDFQSENALQGVEKEVSRILKLLKKYDIEEASLDSSQTSLQAEYDYSQNPRVLLGYRANRQVTFNLTKLEQLEKVINDIGKSSITEINHIQYTVKDAEKYENQALKNAITIAQSKAALIAQSLGVELSTVLRVNHQVSQNASPVFARAMSMEMDMAKKSTYEQKDIEISTFIDISFGIKQ